MVVPNHSNLLHLAKPDPDGNSQRSLRDHSDHGRSMLPDRQYWQENTEPASRPYFGVQEPNYTEGGGFGRQNGKAFGEIQPGSLAGILDYDQQDPHSEG